MKKCDFHIFVTFSWKYSRMPFVWATMPQNRFMELGERSKTRFRTLSWLAVLLFFFVNRNINHVKVWKLLLLRSPSSVHRFWSMVAQKNGVREYFQKKLVNFWISVFFVNFFYIYNILLSKILMFWTRRRNENEEISAKSKIQEYNIRENFYSPLKYTTSNFERDPPSISNGPPKSPEKLMLDPLRGW